MITLEPVSSLLLIGLIGFVGSLIQSASGPGFATIAALIGTALGTGLGFYIFRRLEMKSIKLFIYAFMITAGVYLTFLT